MSAGEPSVSLVVFDLGGVIVKICRSWPEGCAAAGLDVRADVMSGNLIAQRRALHAKYERGHIACHEFFEGISQSLSGLYTPEEVRRVHLAWTVGEYPGVGSVIDALDAAGVRTGVLSNTNHSHWELLDPPAGTAVRYPTIQRISNRHASHLLGLAKPDEAIYREFARRAGYAGREQEILFFDDLADNIAGARAAGWRAEQIDHTRATDAQMLDHLRRAGVIST